MRWLRAVWRALRAGAATALLYLAWLAGHAALCVAPARRSLWRRAVMRRWCAALCRALAVRVSTVGAAPRGGVLLVSNHVSYIDIVVLGSTLDTVFVSKAEVADWPGLGFLAREFGTLFLARGRKRDLPDVNRQIERALALGDGVVVFPEGTSTDGSDVLPFRASLLAPAAQARIPVHFAVLSYRTGPRDPPAAASVGWWGNAPFLPHVARLLRLDSIEARVEFGERAIVSADRKELAARLQEAVRARLPGGA